MGRHRLPRPDVTMTVAVPPRAQIEHAAEWNLGECWLCDDNGVKPVAWVGPVVTHTENGPQRAPLYACSPCLARIDRRVVQYRHERAL